MSKAIARYQMNTYEDAVNMRKELYEKSKAEHNPILVIIEKQAIGWVVFVYSQTFSARLKKIDPLTSHEVLDIISHEDNQEKKMFITTLAYSGRRVSEIVGTYGVRPIDIDREHNEIRFTILKKRGEKIRHRISCPDFLVSGLYYYSEYMKPDQVIFNRTRQWGYNVVSAAGQRVGIKAHPHLFRHTYAAELARNAETPRDVLTIKSQLAHSRIQTTYDYIEEFNKKESQRLVGRSFKRDEE